MRRILLAAACIAALLPPPAVIAAPRAEHIGECDFYWDIAITARGMAMAKVERELGRSVIWRIFNPQVDKRAIEIGNAIVDAAYSRPWAPNEHAGHFAAQLKSACYDGGNMDSVLGVRL